MTTKYILVDVDTQNAFASRKGNLSVYDEGVTPGVLNNIRDLVGTFVTHELPIVGSVDSHSYDSWEFTENGGPFPVHAVKGTEDWLKVPGTLPPRSRFIPMAPGFEVGGLSEGSSNRTYDADKFTVEALSRVAMYFEKEVYSLFANPLAAPYLSRLVEEMLAEDGVDSVKFVVVGFCTGGFCVDAAVSGLLSRDYGVILLSDATQAIDGVNAPDGLSHSLSTLSDEGAEVLSTSEFYNLFLRG